MFERIYVDMDGVLADFDGHFEDMTGVISDEYEDKYGRERFWEKVYENPTFFRDLKIFPFAKELIELCMRNSKDDVIILSSPSRYNTEICVNHKRQWIDMHLGSNFPAIFTKDKYKFAGKGRLLIDDTFEKVQTWREYDGEAYHFHDFELFKKWIEWNEERI